MKNCLFCKKELKEKEGQKYCSTNCRVKAYQRRKKNTPNMPCYVCKKGTLTYKMTLNSPAPMIRCNQCATTWKAEIS